MNLFTSQYKSLYGHTLSFWVNNWVWNDWIIDTCTYLWLKKLSVEVILSFYISFILYWKRSVWDFSSCTSCWHFYGQSSFSHSNTFEVVSHCDFNLYFLNDLLSPYLNFLFTEQCLNNTSSNSKTQFVSGSYFWYWICAVLE